MANHNTEKVYVKKINIACMAIAAVLLALTVFAYSTLLGTFEVAGVSMNMTADELLNIFENEPAKLFGFFILFAVSIISIVAIVNVIRLIVGWFGFLGDKDSRFVAHKLAKHAKIAFGTVAGIITAHVLTSADDGVYASNVTLLFVLTGIAFALTYLLVRFYRWFVVEKRAPQEYVFILLRDAMYVAFPVILFGIISPTAIGDIAKALTNIINGSNKNFLLAQNLQSLFSAIAEALVLTGILSIMEKTLQSLPFDNYKKPAYKSINGKYIPLVILPFLIVVVGAVVVTCIEYSTFNISAFTDYILGHLDMIFQLLLATISVHVLGAVDKQEEFREIKLVVNAPAEQETAVAKEASENEETLLD